jgi:hypothetical protein
LFAIELAAVAVKWPVGEPLVINRPEGTVRLGLLLPIESALQPTDTLFSVTVHVLADPPVKLAGVQLTELGPTEVTRLRVTLPELGPRVAVTVADWLLEVVVVVMLKAADVAPGGIATDGGTVSVGFVLVRVTVAPPVGAGCVRLTVQVLEELGPRLVGLQTSEETRTGAARVMVALAELLL